MHPMCEDEIIRSLSERARIDITDAEDQKAMEMMNKAISSNYGSERPLKEPKFDRKRYEQHIKSMNKLELFESVVSEAERRFRTDVEANKLRLELRETQEELDSNWLQP